MDPHLARVPPWMILPFIGLLAAIALAPLAFSGWWQKHYPKVSIGLGLIPLAGYVWILDAPERIGHTAVEYVSFIALIGSLFVVSGGIHITVRGEATPLANTLFLAIGAIVANLLGTTGASMLLIRPWLRMNHYRVTGHHVVFFIFIVSNVGGCLTPIGDPPLFLGYLRAVPFWWVAAQGWPAWLTGVGILLAFFYAVDRRNYLRAPRDVREKLAEPGDVWRFEGLHNLAFLAVILGAVFIRRPPFLREGMMLAAAAGSYATTRAAIHAANHFDFQPIREVAILFAGIFATMIPALDWLQAHAGALGSPTPAFFFWASGTLSSVLDNAPTYLSFLSTAFGAFVDPETVRQVMEQVNSNVAGAAGATGVSGDAAHAAILTLARYYPGDVAAGRVSSAAAEMAVVLGQPLPARCLLAISVGAVFFGANTYIGNGPNFLVKAIADQKRVHTPTFLGYVIKYTLPFMVPMLAAVWWMFFR